MSTAPFWKSRTVLFNLLALGYGLVSYYHGPVTSVSPETIAIVASVINVALRFVTKGTITLTPASAAA
jgi:hypothetical protein